MALPNWFFTLLPLALIGLAVIFFWISAKLKDQTGMPDGKIITQMAGGGGSLPNRCMMPTWD